MPRRQMPVDSSWRMVEGDNDSFDTTVVNSLDDEIYLHSYPSSQNTGSVPSQQPSQISHVTSSQGSIGDFVARADDERVLMRTPFRPSMPPGSVAGGRRISDAAASAYKTPEPEFHMPRMPVGGGAGQRMFGGAHETDGGEMSPRARRRKGSKNTGGRGSGSGASDRAGERMGDRMGDRRGDPRTRDIVRPRTQNVTNNTWAASGGNFAAGAAGEVAKWMLQVVGMALRWTQKPLSIIVAVYMLFGVWTMVANMVTRSVMVSLQPICRIPGASFLDLPFCGPWLHAEDDNDQGGASHVEFDDLMLAQSQFEQVLERSADGVSLPLQMRRSGTSIRDLRTVVRYSDLPDKEELLQELDGFVVVADQAARDLQYFNTHVGSAVDAVISINRWTARFIDEMADEQRTMGGDGPVVTALMWLLPAPLNAWGSWALSPFQPSLVFDEKQLVMRYVENTAMVSERIAGLLVEAQALLVLLTRADQHLDGMHDVVTRQNRQVVEQRDVLVNIWSSFFGANRAELDSVRSQLSLLKQVGRQRQSAIQHVNELVHDLEMIQARLVDLRERVAAPAVISSTAGAGGVPLSVHIETIMGGIERLDWARRRMREQEEAKVREVVAAGGRVDEPLQIEGRAG